ncbi:MAG: hypothetical protein CBB87_09280 [Micavibrio sp. TMED27]|nr:hypothetical protein [Micavibrio sp.]OUT90332.1 MAG: hypothetical protein CBB87_09280 [Micavibrio sp. TMED27]|tara:strand:+ start:362 stop:589 length:228 start_codon:yes stop_codon:yes gene_type:complete
MSLTVEQATEAVYESLDQNNLDIDFHIDNLKKALTDAGEKQAVFKPEKLAQNNRAGRKMMQSYFKKRGVKVIFED